MKARYRSLAPLIRWRELERPIDWPAQFGRRTPLELEIGFGNGEFLVRQAQAHPDRNFIGIEPEWASIARALGRIARSAVINIRLLQAQASVVLERLVAPQSLAHVYALFPCPWPKRRHEKHRLFSHDFLRLLNSRLGPGGDARILTDSAAYARWIEEQSAQTSLAVRTALVAPNALTKYERKWQALGQEAFHELQLRKQEHVDVVLQQEISMETYRVARFDPERFQPTTIHGEVTVEFKDFLFDAQRQRGMVRVVTAEGGFTQDCWIEIVGAAHGWHIRPSRGCQFVPTVAIQRALDLTREAAVGAPRPSPVAR